MDANKTGLCFAFENEEFSEVTISGLEITFHRHCGPDEAFTLSQLQSRIVVRRDENLVVTMSQSAVGQIKNRLLAQSPSYADGSYDGVYDVSLGPLFR